MRGIIIYEVPTAVTSSIVFKYLHTGEFWKKCVCGDSFHGIRVDDRIKIKIDLFKFHQIKMDTCGRDHRNTNLVLRALLASVRFDGSHSSLRQALNSIITAEWAKT